MDDAAGAQRRRGPTLRAGAVAAVAMGLAPRPALSLGLDLGARWSFFSIAAEARGALHAGPDGDGGARASALNFGVVPCLHWSAHARFEPFGCGVAEVGVLRARAAPANMQLPAEDSVRAFGLFGARAGFEIPILPHVALRFMTEVAGAGAAAGESGRVMCRARRSVRRARRARRWSGRRGSQGTSGAAWSRRIEGGSDGEAQREEGGDRGDARGDRGV